MVRIEPTHTSVRDTCITGRHMRGADALQPSRSPLPEIQSSAGDDCGVPKQDRYVSNRLIFAEGWSIGGEWDGGEGRDGEITPTLDPTMDDHEGH